MQAMLETSCLSSSIESSHHSLMSSLESSHFVQTTLVKSNLFLPRLESPLVFPILHCQCLGSNDFFNNSNRLVIYCLVN